MRKKTQQLLDDLKEMRRCWKLKKEALDSTLCKTHFGLHDNDQEIHERVIKEAKGKKMISMT
jgi:hypothetical protein